MYMIYSYRSYVLVCVRSTRVVRLLGSVVHVCAVCFEWNLSVMLGMLGMLLLGV